MTTIGAPITLAPRLFFDARGAHRIAGRLEDPRTARYASSLLAAAEHDARIASVGGSWVDAAPIKGGAPYVEMAIAHDGRERLIRLALAYILTREHRFAASAASLTEAGLRREWHAFTMSDLVIAAWLHGMIAASDWLSESGDFGDPQDPNALASRLRERALVSAAYLAHDLVRGGNVLRRNHDLIEAATVGLVALAHPDSSQASGLLRLGLEKVDALLSELVGEDGDWYEGTVRYQCYLLHWLVPFADACRHAGVRDYYATDTVRRLFQALLSWITPNGWNLGFNDGNHDEMAKMAPWLLAKAASEYRDGAFLWALERLRAAAPDVPFPDQHVVLHLDPERAPALSEPHHLPVIHLRRTGMVVTRTGWGERESLFALQCGPYVSHDHLDKSTFEFYYRGVPLVLDTGCGQYPDRGRFLPERMHNVVAVDGGYPLQLVHPVYGSTGFDFCPPFHGRIRDVLSDGEATVVRADYSRLARIARAQRTAVFLRPGYLLLLDELADTDAHRYEHYVHARGTLEIGSDRAVWRTPEGTELTLLVVAPTAAPIDAGVHEFALQSSADMLIEHSGPLWHRRNGELRYSKVTSRGTATRFVMVLLPHAPDEPPMRYETFAVERADGFEIENPDFRDVWVSQPDGRLISANGLETDACLAFVRLRSGVPTTWLVADGRRLSWQGRPLVASPIPTTFIGHAQG